MIYSRTLHAQPYFTFQRSSAALFRRLVHSHLIKAGFPTGYSVIFNNFERVVSLINFSRYRVSRYARESMRNESWISRVRQYTLVDSIRSSYSYYSNFDAISNILFLFFYFLFLFSFFFFPRASAANWSQRRHGVSSVLPFSSCACRRPSRRGSALVRQHGRPRRRMVTRATNATRRAIPQAILRSRTFLPSLFLAVCARSLCRPNGPDWLRAFDFTTAETKAASRRLPIERFRPILLNIIASGTTTIYLFPRCIAAEVAISWYRACTRSFDTSSFVLLLGNDFNQRSRCNVKFGRESSRKSIVVEIRVR